MTASRIDIPSDAVLGDWSARLDPARVLEVCREQLTHIESDVRKSWQACRMIEALYHPGRYLRTAYVLLADPSTPPHRQWPQGQIVYLHAPVRRPISRRGVELRIDDTTVEAYCFPNDRRLRGMRKFAGKRDAVATWQRWIDEAAGGFAIDADSLQRLLVRYVPEQKWVIRLRAEGTSRDTGRSGKRRLVVRSARRESCARLLDRHRALAAWARGGDGLLIVPDVVGGDIAEGLLAVECIRGETLVETLQRNDPGDVMAKVARTLKLWHTAPLDGLPSLKRDDLVQSARDAAADLGAACPPLRARWDALAAEINARLGAVADSEPATLHNDFHWNQLRIKRGRFAVLDLERMARGDPLVDVANFATQIRMLGLRDAAGVDAETAEKWSNVFLDRWASVSGRAIDADRYCVYAVVSLFGLARGMMRHLREGWRELAETSLQQGESLLAAGGVAMSAHASTKTKARGNLAELFDLGTLEPLLRSIIRFEGRRPKQPHDVRIERCWPMHAGGFRFEWSFRLSGAKRYRLVGVAGDRRYAQRSHAERPGRVTPRGIRRLRAYARRYGLVVFSLDRDPRMPHVRRCLDPHEMAARLRPYFADLGVPQGAGPGRIVAKPLTYKAGRRAVIAYRLDGTRSERLRLLGKTFRNDRARDFETTYRRVGEQLLRISGGRVGGPTIVGAIDDLRMALFAWSPGRSIANGAKLEAAGLQSAIDVLCTLHRVELDDLPTFSVADECAVARRWQAALVLAGHPAADKTRVLFDALERKSRDVPAQALRTVHRDFYERQLIWGARRTTLLDLDTLTLGDPCLDLATFFAHAYLDRLRSSASKPDYAALVGTFLPCYERAMGEVDRGALAFYGASAAIRLGAVHALRCETREHAPALWKLAESLLKKTVGRRPRSLPARRSPRRAAPGRKVV